LGFSEEEVIQLIKSCPKTCGICNSLGNPALLEFVLSPHPSTVPTVK